MPNTLYSYSHVEDYIEIIAGYRTPAGINKQNIFLVAEPNVSLARYDVKVIESFAGQCHSGLGFTDKQASLAVALVTKYERQLFKLGVDITPVKTNPEFRIPLRTIDRTARAWIEDDLICIKFPFDNEIIESIRTEGKQSKGSIHWEHGKKYWVADLTEPNVNWVYTFAQQHKFEIDSTLKTAMDLLLAEEKKQYGIELQATADALTITNAHDALVDYVNDRLGGLVTGNLLTLVDNAPILGYTVDNLIKEVVIEAYGTRFWSLCANRELKVDQSFNSNLVKSIADYATATNRFPIFVYEPDLSDRLLTEFNKHFPDQVLRVTNNQLADFDFDVKVIYTTKIPRTPVGRIPLMISSAGMMYGGDRQMWIQTAEKIVYFTKDVYNKHSKGPEVCKLN